jgi:hypothetical protein
MRSRLKKYMWGVKCLFSYSIRVLLITFLTVVPGVPVGLVVYCGRGAMWLGRRRCHTRASGFCVEVLPVDICTVSAVGSMVIVCGEGVKTKCVLTDSIQLGPHMYFVRRDLVPPPHSHCTSTTGSKYNMTMALLQGRNM